LKLTEDEARRRLATAPVARLAPVAAARPATATAATAPAAAVVPHIIPVTFVLAGDRIFSAVDAKPKTTRQLQRLRNIRASPGVAVLADHYEDDWTKLWWVRADGRAGILEDPAETAGPIRALIQRYPQYRGQPPTGPVIAIAVERWTGWAAS